MARCLTLAALLAGAFAYAPRASCAPPEAPRPVFEHLDVDVAWRAAQKHKRPMLLFVSAADCRFCTKMIRETYSHPQIARALASSCETALVTREQRPELVRQLRVRAYPTTIVVAPDGKELGRIEGFLDARKFATQLFGAPGAASAAARPSAPSRGVAQR